VRSSCLYGFHSQTKIENRRVISIIIQFKKVDYLLSGVFLVVYSQNQIKTLLR